jgi:hypothetical protein
MRFVWLRPFFSNRMAAISPDDLSYVSQNTIKSLKTAILVDADIAQHSGHCPGNPRKRRTRKSPGGILPELLVTIDAGTRTATNLVSKRTRARRYTESL